MNIKCLFGHKWVHHHQQNGFSSDATHTYWKQCHRCDKKKPDPENERFGNFCMAARAQGLDTKTMQQMVRAGKY